MEVHHFGRQRQLLRGELHRSRQHFLTIQLFDKRVVVIGTSQTHVLRVITEHDIGFVHYVLVFFLHRSAGLRAVFLFVLCRLGLVLRRGGRKLFAVVFLLRLGVCNDHLSIRLCRLLRLYRLLARLQVMRFLTVAVRRGLVALLRFRLSRQVVTGQEIRITGNERVHVLHYVFPLFELHLYQGTLVTHLHFLRLQFDSRVKVLQGAVVIAYLLTHHTAVVVAIGFPRRDLHRLVVVRQRPAVVMAAVM